MRLGIALSAIVALSSASADADRNDEPQSTKPSRQYPVPLSMGLATKQRSARDATKKATVLRNGRSEGIEPTGTEAIDDAKGEDPDFLPDLGVIGTPAVPASVDAGKASTPWMHPDEQRVLKPRTDCAADCPNGRPVIKVSGPDFRNLLSKCGPNAWFCPYDLPTNCWDTSRVTDMSYAFAARSIWPGSFNEPLNCWDVSSVTSMRRMFYAQSSFNQPIGNWDVSRVGDMEHTFSLAKNFNQPIGDWDVSSVTNMMDMFNEAFQFNQPIGDWNVSRVKRTT
ncbi:unnamed protein product, partial [Pseudo-nitzschia multistriata]